MTLKISRPLSLSIVVPALMLAGCQMKDASQDNSAQAANGADANSTPPTLVQNVQEPASMNALPPVPVEPVAPGNSASDTLINANLPMPAPTATEEASGSEKGTDAQAAKQVVQRYYAAISGGDYATARGLWENDGKASGRSAEQFAKQFDRYSSYQADIGTPGRIDAGAGQRHIDVPVTLHGTLRGGATAFRTKAVVTLHRTADIDGATAAQKQWHIARIKMPQGATGK